MSRLGAALQPDLHITVRLNLKNALPENGGSDTIPKSIGLAIPEPKYYGRPA